MPEENLQQENELQRIRHSCCLCARAVWGGSGRDHVLFAAAAMQRTIFVAPAAIPALARLLRDVPAAPAQCVVAARSRTHRSRLTQSLIRRDSSHRAVAAEFRQRITVRPASEMESFPSEEIAAPHGATKTMRELVRNRHSTH